MLSIPLCIIIYNKSINQIAVQNNYLTTILNNYIIIHNGKESITLLACQAKSINTYRNTKTKFFKYWANIYFNK
jgi:hypothetical protein